MGRTKSRATREWQKSQESALSDIQDGITDTSKSLSDLNDTVSDLSKTFKEFLKTLQKSDEEIAQESRDKERERLENTTKYKLASKVVDKAIANIERLAVSAAHAAQKFQDIDNSYIKTLSLSQARSSVIKSNASGIISSMNDSNGRNAYRVDETYQELLSAFSSSSVRDDTAMQELVGPLTLAMNTMQVDTSKMSSYFARLYTRYTFSSEEMNDTLNSILKYTENSNVDQKTVAENIMTFSTWAEQNSRLSGMSEDQVTEYLSNVNDALSLATSRYESVGIDTSQLMQELVSIYTGDYDSTELNQKLILAGSSVEEMQRLLKDSVNTEVSLNKAMDIMAESHKVISDNAAQYKNALDVAENAYLSKDYRYDTDIANSLNKVMTVEDYKKFSESSMTMEELAADKFVGVGESMTNAVNNWGYRLSEQLENLPIPLSGSDVEKAVITAAGILSVTTMKKTLRSSIFEAFTGSSVGGTSGGGLVSLLKSPVMNTSTGFTGIATSVLTDAVAAAGAAYVGYNIGNVLGKLITGEEDLYNNFKFTGEGGFFDQLLGPLSESTDKLSAFNDLLYDTKSALEEMATGEDTNWIVRALTDAIAPGIAISGEINKLYDNSQKSSDHAVTESYTGFAVGMSAANKYATGLSYVPEDDYPALLHEGERVLTRSEATELRRLGTLDFSDYEKSLDTAVDMSEISSLLSEIISLLSVWREDEIRAQDNVERLQRISDATSRLSQYSLQKGYL